MATINEVINEAIKTVEETGQAVHDLVKIGQEEKYRRRRERNEVVVIDLHMPFSSMVVFMVKWAIASIPALIILLFLYFFIFTIILGSSL